MSFKNSTQPGGFEAVSYRHTTPADFSLSGGDGRKRAPIVDASCPSWPELRVERGGTAGPVRLCFAAPAAGLRGALLVWTPDTGIFPVTGTVPLD